MYKNIVLCVDNSKHSKIGERLGIEIAKRFNASLAGLHVYSGKFHQFRFKVLEDFLPDKYQNEDTLEYQRKIHTVLIDRGLELVSWEYMKELSDNCKLLGIPFKEKIVDGKNSDQIINESSHFDLVIMGAHGLGEMAELSKLGTNTQRVIRHTNTDVLIAKKDCTFNKILVGIDGSVYAHRMFEKALNFAKIFHSELKLVTSFNPLLHQTVFSTLAGVLSDESGKVFKFKEQEDLHTMVIDKSLEGLYRNYLEVLKQLAEENGMNVETELLTGKPVYALYQKVLEDEPDLLVVGKFGMHKGQHEQIGSTAENIAELATTNVLIVSVNEPSNRKENSNIKAGEIKNVYEKVSWTDEAKKRLENIPTFARPMAILAIERYAKEKGYRIITPEIMKKARDSAES